MTHFAHWQLTDISIVNEYFVCIYFHTALGFATIRVNNIFISQFIALQCCYHNYIAIFATFSFLRAEGNWWPFVVDFWKPRLEEYKAPSSLSLRQYPPEVLHCSGNRISVTSGKDYNKCISVVKMRLKLQQVGFWNDQKSANVVMWKDKEYEYISSTWNKQH